MYSTCNPIFSSGFLYICRYQAIYIWGGAYIYFLMLFVKFIEKNLFHIVKKIVTGGNSYMCMSNPCGAGLSQFTVDPNADVYPCADLCGQKHFRLGNIGEDFFPMIPSCEGWREIRSYKLQNLTGCKKCTLIKTCPAGCSVRCYYSNDSVHSTDPLCGFYKLILPYLDDTGLAKKIYNIYVN